MLTAPAVRARSLAALTLAALAFFIAYGADGAEAAGISCGDLIKKDTTLQRDLLNCPNAGIVIGADGVTLDLNGHTIDGDNELVRKCPDESKTDFCEDGIVNEGHSGVTVVGGEVREFAFGVSFYNADDGEVRGTTATRSVFNGILFFRVSDSLISGATASANGLEHDYPGIAIVESDGNRIERTTSTGNADLGFYVTESNNNVFVRNTLSANPEAGAIIDGDGNVVRGNRIARNGEGLIMDGSNNTIARNQIQRSLGCGNGCGIGISLEDGRGNRIVGNVIRSPKKTGIRLTTFVGEQNLRDTIVRRNVVRDAGRNGIEIGPTITGTILLRNHVRRSGEDGIHVESASTTLRRNHANRNGDLGIAAVPGVIDAGGNLAAGNGTATQCTYVICG